MNHYLYSHEGGYELDQWRCWRINRQGSSTPDQLENAATAKSKPKPRKADEKRPAARRAGLLRIDLPDLTVDPLETLLHSGEGSRSRIAPGAKWRPLRESDKEQRAALFREADNCERKYGSRFVRDCADAASGQFKHDPTGIWIGNIVRMPTARMAVALYHFSRESCGALTLGIGQHPPTATNGDFEQLEGLTIADESSAVRLALAEEQPGFPNAPSNQPHPKTIKAIGKLTFQTDDGPVTARDEDFVAEIGEANPPWIYDLLVNGYGVLRWPSRGDAITFLRPIIPSET